MNITDFVEYHWAKNHPKTADDVDEMRKYKTKSFYIQDPKKEIVKKHNTVQTAKRADREFIKATDDPKRMKNLLRVLGSARVEGLTDEMVENMLYDIKQSRPKAFIAAAIDKELDLRAEISSFIEYSVLVKVGNAILYQDDTIADDMDGAVKYLKNKANSGILNTLRAKLKEALR